MTRRTGRQGSGSGRASRSRRRRASERYSQELITFARCQLSDLEQFSTSTAYNTQQQQQQTDDRRTRQQPRSPGCSAARPLRSPMDAAPRRSAPRTTTTTLSVIRHNHATATATATTIVRIRTEDSGSTCRNRHSARSGTIQPFDVFVSRRWRADLAELLLVPSTWDPTGLPPARHCWSVGRSVDQHYCSFHTIGGWP